MPRLAPAWDRVGIPALVLVIACCGFVQKVHGVAPHIRAIGTRQVAAGGNLVGRDFALSVWIPGRALVEGHDPYDPRATVVADRYGNDGPAGLYTPSLLVLLGPLILMPLPIAIAAMTALSYILIWLALLVIVQPKSRWHWALVAGLGIATTFGYAGENTILLGQPTALVLLGLTLAALPTAARFQPAAEIAGIVLLLQKPQYAIPVIVFVAARRRWRALIVGTAVTLAVSLPFAILELAAAGGVEHATRSIRANLAYFDLLNSRWGRTDLLTLLTWGNPRALGAGGLTIVFIALAGIAMLVVRRARPAAADAVGVAALLTGFALTGLYHSDYDLLIVVVPAALVLVKDRPWSSSLWALAAAYLVINLVSRPSFLDHASPFVQRVAVDYWPPIISLAFFVLGARYWVTAGERPIGVRRSAA